jgi:hypothetical protein
MTHATRIALAAAAMILVIICGLGVDYLLVEHVIQHSQQQWCDTITLLTTTPVPSPSDPANNPSRVAEYRLYKDFVTLKRRFNCKEPS